MARTMLGTSAAAHGAGTDAPSQAPAGSPQRITEQRSLPGGRALLGGLLMAASAVGVFLAYAGASADAGDPVVVAATGIRVGDRLEAEDVRIVEAELPDSTDTTFDAIDQVVGRIALGPIGPGEILQASSLTDDRSVGASHEIALRLPGDQVAVGRLKQGERVDVYVTRDDRTAPVVQGARVVQIDLGDDSALGSGDELTIVVGVSSADAVSALVHALRTGEVTVVRSTFATEHPAAPETTASTAGER